MIQFKYRYFVLTIILLLIETFIALYVHDDIVRPHVGDLLAAILVYCAIRSFLKLPPSGAALIALVFCYLVETLQYFKIVEKLGLIHSTIACVLIGTSFSWIDMFAYTVGIGCVLLAEKLWQKTGR